jgi:hypothetical protein
MVMHVEVIKYALEHTESAEAAAAMILQFEQVQQNIVNRDAKVAAINKKAKQQIADLMHQRICDHEVQRFCPDPSGGSDSGRQCLICNVWLDDKPVRFT